MEALKFKLSGKNAFFKKPEVNSYVYFTYGNIHKVALLGVFGAILGYGGYSQLDGKGKNPEFYNKLKHLKVAICPLGNNGAFGSKIQYFNNSVGYASKEEGGNLVVKQQWLDNPKWEIYILLDCSEALKIKDMILNNKCIYMPYLGSNDHPANITDCCVIQCDNYDIGDDRAIIDSLFLAKEGAIDADYVEEYPFHYTEFLPIGLHEKTNMYAYQKLEHTNIPVKGVSNLVKTEEEKKIVFI
ncbi:type I-B CRISPR-associated protein Cas5b [Eubacteriales bacterium KG127]